MKQITLTIEFCEECPRCDIDNCICLQEDKKIEDIYELPEWCPLEDY